MTNAEFVTSAFRLAGILAETDSLPAEYGVTGMQAMNDLFAEWDANSIDVGFFPRADIQETSPIFADAMLAARYGLALLLCSEYGVQPKPIVASIAASSYGRILRDAMVAKQSAADMTHLPGVVEQTNIETG